ncbi:MAG TPA: alpha/beta hydrolase [Anaerolineaceae bacterium]|nr:alpha/beta hydrolase [Anaerolineaceae bacterium]
MHRGLRIFLVLISLVIGLSTAGFVVWGETPAQPMPEALAALKSDVLVTVTSGQWLVFTPTTSQPTVGFIFYPGGRVDYRAYAPVARQIAEKGYLVVIVRMPLNLAVFGVNNAHAVLAAYPQIRHWAIGDHSLGGAMAATFARAHPGAIQGLALWAAYPASSDDLSDSMLHVVSIFGSQDGLATEEKINASRESLPADTTWVQITGGNHAQFGWYGDQAGDNPASISRSNQQVQVVRATLRMLENLK